MLGLTLMLCKFSQPPQPMSRVVLRTSVLVLKYPHGVVQPCLHELCISVEIMSAVLRSYERTHQPIIGPTAESGVLLSMCLQSEQ